MSVNNQLDDLYEKTVDALDFDGSGRTYDGQQLYKNYRAKLRRALRKAYTFGKADAPEATAFVWLDHRGKKHLPQQMATLHLFYAIRMIWNHSVPEYYRIPGVRKYSDVPHWSAEYRKEALQVLGAEFESRPINEALNEDQLREVAYMRMATKIINDSV